MKHLEMRFSCFFLLIVLLIFVGYGFLMAGPQLNTQSDGNDSLMMWILVGFWVGIILPVVEYLFDPGFLTHE